MSAVTLADVLSIEEFAAVRPRRQQELVQVKAARRLGVGEHLTLLFENRATVLWQVQEMCRVEGIRAPEAVQHEVDTYARLLPGPSELSATLLVEYAEAAERGRALVALWGLHEHLWLEVDGRRLPFSFDAEQYDERRISAVQFVRVPLDAEARAAFFDLARPVAVVVDHPWYRARAVVPAAVRGALCEDLVAAAG